MSFEVYWVRFAKGILVLEIPSRLKKKSLRSLRFFVSSCRIYLRKSLSSLNFGSMKYKSFLIYGLTFLLGSFPVLHGDDHEESSSGESLFPAKLLDNKGKEVSSSVLGDKIVGIYFSAQWCPPCRHFTPTLVNFRNSNDKDFEVVFVSSDRSSEDQLKYMDKYGMKWYTLPHGSKAANNLKKKFEVRGIPALVIVDSKGNTITKNGRGDVSKDPKTAIAEWRKKS